jgi:HSP20 family protein
MALVKYAPFSGFEPFPGLKAFEDTMSRLFTEPNGRPWVPAVDVKENEHELVLTADVPGLKFEDIDVRLENGTLTLKGERKFESSDQKNGWHRLERSYGAFHRVFELPDTIEAEGVKADYKNGVLTVVLPKKEIAKPKQIKVQVNNN